ncbi:MAG: acyl carrier protein [Coxiella-like endosymbiont]|uniref:acyl carrier protein n=1 Tax=Coxiella-like endosymbiont TaxID=1592897 RepID=UPI00359CAB58
MKNKNRNYTIKIFKLLKLLANIIDQINLEISKIDLSAYISEYGLDSLIVSEIISTMNENFG